MATDQTKDRQFGQQVARPTLADRLLNKVVKVGECWIWTGKKNSRRYGAFWHRGGYVYAHRLSWEIHRGTIPEGLCVLHNCPGGDNPLCVNPAHLWLGTQTDNMADRGKKGRTRAKLNSELVMAIRKRYAGGEVTQRQLGEEHGVGENTINKIIRRRSWGWL